MELIYHNVTQGTDQWKELKAGKFGGTTADTFLVNGKAADGIGTGLRKLIYEKCAECVTGADLDGYSSLAMERGVDLEPIARSRYESERFAMVEQVGYIQAGDYFGVSPDGLVGEDGAVEIKCPEGTEFVRWMDTREIPKGYYCQMQWLLFLTGREWCDFVVFNPDFAPLDLSIERVFRDEKVIAELDYKVRVVAAEMERVLEVIAQKEAA